MTTEPKGNASETRPLVSVVIPTCNRPQQVVTAVRSALAQTLQAIEVIVVSDDGNPATEQNLKDLNDPRLRIVTPPAGPHGPGPAREAGAKVAQADWIAFLDDDDEWLPAKLERQLAVARESRHELPLVYCQSRVHRSEGTVIWPRRPLRTGELICEYLFTRHSLFAGEGFIQSSTLLVAKKALEAVSFAEAPPPHDDWDWLLRFDALPDSGVEFVPEPLSVWNAPSLVERISNRLTWEKSLAWCQERRPYMTRRAYAGAMATVVSPAAAAAGKWRVLPMLLRETFRHGQPRLFDLLLLVGMWCLPAKRRRQLGGRRFPAANPQE